VIVDRLRIKAYIKVLHGRPGGDAPLQARTVIISLCGLDDIACIPYRLVVILGVSNTFIRSALRMNIDE
jgi:hypothetical protein